MTETTTETKPERFALDRDAATAWLTQALYGYEGEREERYKHLTELDDSYTAQEDWESGSGTAALVCDAQQLGALTGPCEITYDYDYSQYGDHGYTWCVRMGRLNLRTLFDDLRHCGDGGEQPGIPAALAVLREAVNAGNDLLDDLARYVAEQPPVREPASECIDVCGHLAEEAFRHIGQLLGAPLGRHKPGSTRYVFEAATRQQADTICAYLESIPVGYNRETTVTWGPHQAAAS